jgi:SAM-dependent methyltransferase
MSVNSHNQPAVNYPLLYEEMHRLQDRNWWFRVHYPAILDLVRPYLKPGMKVLDLGSAAGWSTRDLPAGVKRIVLDIRPLALSYCRERSLGRLCADAHQLPLRTGSCDAVICEGLLHQVEAHDPRRIAEEMVRVCRPGGVIGSAEPAFDCLFGSHDLVYGGARRFRLGGLLKLFSGLPVICRRKTYLHLFVFLPALIVRRFCRRTRTDLNVGNSLTNAVCVGLGTVERWLIRLFPLPFGITAAVILQRRSEADER